MPSLNALSFDTTGLLLQEDGNTRRAWRGASGAEVLASLFELAPDIAAPLDAIDDLRRFYRSAVMAAGMGVIEIDTLRIGTCTAVRTLFKAPQQPSGMTYLGCITLPFRDFSFVVKVQCAEHGTTGVRDAVILDAMIGSGRISLEDLAHLPKGSPVPGWAQDPYDPAVQGPFLRNLAEDAQHDTQFPNHPLSRARAHLRRIQATLRLAPEVAEAAPFVYPAVQTEPAAPKAPTKPWWQVW